MFTSVALIFSILLQFFAAFFALRLIKVTKGRLSWIFLSVAFLFMAIRRMIEIIPYIFEKNIPELSVLNNWTGIIISILIALGVILISEIFYSLKKAEKERAESEKKFKTLFNNSSDCIFVSDLAGNILEVNQVACDTLDYSKEEFLKKKISDIVSNKYSNLIDNNIERIKTSGQHIFELEHLSKDGKIIPVEIKARKIDYNNNETILSIARDITERKQTERKILNAVIETEEKDKERFAKDLHDGLGTLLSSINLYLSLIKSEDIDESERQNMLNYTKGLINEAIQNTKEIANNLRPNIITRFGLIASVKSFCENINETGLIKVIFNSDIKKDLDKEVEVTLFRIIKELINNTLKHASANHIEIDLLLNKKLLTLIYIDNGIGFDVDKIMKNKLTEGMGISNIISRIKAINGICKINSSKGKGIKVIIEVEL